MAAATRQVHVAPSLKAYLVDVAQATRRSTHLALGVSPRATLALQRVARARAASGRGYVIPDDVKALAVPVLAHRLLVTPEAQLQGITPADALGEVLRAGAPAREALTACADPPGVAVPVGRGGPAGRGPPAGHRRAVRVRRRRSAWWPWPPCTCASPGSTSRSTGSCTPRRVHAGQPQPGRGRASATCGQGHAGAAAARPGDRHRGRRAAGAAARPGRRLGRQLPAAHRPPRHRPGGAAAGRRGRPVRPGPGDRRRAPGRRDRLPRVDDVRPVPFTSGNDPLAGAAPHALGRTGDDFYALRPYVVGDDLRRIHWPSTARHDELLVRQQEQPWQGRTTVVLDVRRAAHDAASFESGRVGGRQHRDGQQGPARPGPPRHHRRRRLGVRRGRHPPAGAARAPGGGRGHGQRQPAGHARPAAARRTGRRSSSWWGRRPTTSWTTTARLRHRFGMVIVVRVAQRPRRATGARPAAPRAGGPASASVVRVTARPRSARLEPGDERRTPGARSGAA